MKISNINDTLTVQKTLIINQGGNQGGTSTSDLTMNPIYYLEYPITFKSDSSGFLISLGVSISANGQYQTAVGWDNSFNAIIYNSTDFGNTFTENRSISSISPSQSGTFQGVSMSANGQYQTAVGMDNSNGTGNVIIYNSTDFGITFTPISIAQRGGFNGVSMSANGQYQTVVGDYKSAGFIYNSKNSIGVLSA